MNDQNELLHCPKCYSALYFLFPLYHLVLVVIQVLKERDSLRSEDRLPVLVKIAPDLSTQDKQDIAEVIMEVSLHRLNRLCEHFVPSSFRR